MAAGQLWFTRLLKVLRPAACHGGFEIGGKPRQGTRQGQAAKARLTRTLFIFPGDLMAGKRTPSRAKRKVLRSNAPPSAARSMLAMATNNLVNMVAVTTVSGAVLLTLLAIKHF